MMRSVISFSLLAFVLVLTGCDNDPTDPKGTQTEFDVRYSITGTCTESQLGGERLAIEYTIDGGQNEDQFATLPFETVVTINTRGPNTAVMIDAECPGGGTTENTVTVGLYVDDVLRDEDSETGATTLLLSASTILNPQ